MDKQISNTPVYWTTDYSLFKFIAGNRDISEAKIKKLMNDVQHGMDLFKYCPILVNEEMYIIDGQHRFYVCHKLKKNVYYMVVPNFSLAQIAKLNNNQNRWKMSDFLNCYSSAGKNTEHYEYLRQFIDMYHISISTSVSLLYTGLPTTGAGTEHMEVFRNGEFTVKFKNEAELLVTAAYEYAPYTEVSNDRSFLLALQKLLTNGLFNQSEMLKKLEKNSLRIEKQMNTKQYLAHMEEVFNYKNSKRQTIY